jgi:hypothetical protein
MASIERLLISTCFVTHCFRHLLVSHPTKIALQNENGVSSLTFVENKKQLTMPCGGRNCKQHFLQAGILKNCDE